MSDRIDNTPSTGERTMTDSEDFNRLILGHPLWGECDCATPDEHKRRVIEDRPWTDVMEQAAERHFGARKEQGMTTAALTEARHVLRLNQEIAGRPPGALYFHGDDPLPSVELLPEFWRDMGNPEEITVTIQPGDRHTEVPVWARPDVTPEGFDPFGLSLLDRLEALVSQHGGTWIGQTALDALHALLAQEEAISPTTRRDV